MYNGLGFDRCCGCSGGAEDVCVVDFLLGGGGGGKVSPYISESL